MEAMPDKSDKEKAAAKDFDPLFMMDWAPASVVTTSAGSSFEQVERGLSDMTLISYLKTYYLRSKM
jgi:hypothetical protein